MKIKQLLEILSKLDPETEIIMSGDSEGNSFSKLDGYDIGTIHPRDLEEYFLDCYYSDGDSDEDCDLEPGEREKFTKVICLWP